MLLLRLPSAEPCRKPVLQQSRSARLASERLRLLRSALHHLNQQRQSASHAILARRPASPLAQLKRLQLVAAWSPPPPWPSLRLLRPLLVPADQLQALTMQLLPRSFVRFFKAAAQHARRIRARNEHWPNVRAQKHSRLPSAYTSGTKVRKRLRGEEVPPTPAKAAKRASRGKSGAASDAQLAGEEEEKLGAGAMTWAALALGVGKLSWGR